MESQLLGGLGFREQRRFLMGSPTLCTRTNGPEVFRAVEAHVTVRPMDLYRSSSVEPFQVLGSGFFLEIWLAHVGTIRSGPQPVKQSNCTEWGGSFTL